MNIKDELTGLQHIGIPVLNLENSIKFYIGIGFDVIHKKKVTIKEGEMDAAFLQLNNLIIELYELPDELLLEVKQRGNGHIDHIAIDVLDVEKVYKYMKDKQYHIIEEEIQELDFFDKGVRYFMVLGENGEKIEFNQVL